MPHKRKTPTTDKDRDRATELAEEIIGARQPAERVEREDSLTERLLRVLEFLDPDLAAATRVQAHTYTGDFKGVTPEENLESMQRAATSPATARALLRLLMRQAWPSLGAFPVMTLARIAGTRTELPPGVPGPRMRRRVVGPTRRVVLEPEPDEPEYDW